MQQSLTILLLSLAGDDRWWSWWSLCWWSWWSLWLSRWSLWWSRWSLWWKSWWVWWFKVLDQPMQQSLTILLLWLAGVKFIITIIDHLNIVIIVMGDIGDYKCWVNSCESHKSRSHIIIIMTTRINLRSSIESQSHRIFFVDVRDFRHTEAARTIMRMMINSRAMFSVHYNWYFFSNPGTRSSPSAWEAWQGLLLMTMIVFYL